MGVAVGGRLPFCPCVHRLAIHVYLARAISGTTFVSSISPKIEGAGCMEDAPPTFAHSISPNALMVANNNVRIIIIGYQIIGKEWRKRGRNPRK